MNLIKYTILFLMIFLSTSVFGQKVVWENYIKTYSRYATSEMKRTGIPASIKMAQAILESNAGRSQLATKANNHFGIKCGGSWSGETYYREDDDYGSDGKLIESCFRKYDSAVESFIAHSEFLIRNNRRYGFLFDLDAKDYTSWAKGLKKAGYATNPAYADLLISVIEKHKLASFDTLSIDQLMAVATPKEKPKEASLKTIRVNRIKAVKARPGDSPYSIANKYGISISRILKYNDNFFTSSQNLDKGMIVYLQPKHRKFRGRQKYHVVRHGETLKSISQAYGIKYKYLYKRNHIPQGSEVKLGEKIALRGRVRKKNTPILLNSMEGKKTNNPQSPNQVNSSKREDAIAYFKKVKSYFDNEPEIEETIEIDENYLWKEEEKSLEEYTIDIDKPKEEMEDSFTASLGFEEIEEEIIMLPEPTDLLISTPTLATPKTYTVAKGDTLYGICQKNKITLSELKSINNMEGNTIYPGQKLILK